MKFNKREYLETKALKTTLDENLARLPDIAKTGMLCDCEIYKERSSSSYESFEPCSGALELPCTTRSCPFYTASDREVAEIDAFERTLNLMDRLRKGVSAYTGISIKQQQDRESNRTQYHEKAKSLFLTGRQIDEDISAILISVIKE